MNRWWERNKIIIVREIEYRDRTSTIVIDIHFQWNVIDAASVLYVSKTNFRSIKFIFVTKNRYILLGIVNNCIFIFVVFFQKSILSGNCFASNQIGLSISLWLMLLLLSNVNYMHTSHSLKRHLWKAFLRQFAIYERRNKSETSCYLSFSFLYHPKSLKKGKHITPPNGKDSNYSRQPSDRQ